MCNKIFILIALSALIGFVPNTCSAEISNGYYDESIVTLCTNDADQNLKSLNSISDGAKRTLSIADKLCNCMDYRIRSSCDEESGQVTFEIKNVTPISLRYLCIARTVNINIGKSGEGESLEEDDVLLSNKSWLHRGKTGKPISLVVSGKQSSLAVEMSFDGTNYKHMYFHDSTCGEPEYPEYPVCPELVCEIQGVDAQECTGAETLLNYQAAPQENCDSNEYEYETASMSRASIKDPQMIYDPSAQHSWSYECLSSDSAEVVQTDSEGGDTASHLGISLSAPGQGAPVTCKITLQVGRGEEAKTCSLATEVAACKLDCNNEINGTAAFDQCGVCGGENTTCGQAACNGQEIVKSQILLDGSARMMAEIVEKAARIFARITNNKAKANEISMQANQARLQTWSDAWSLPNIVLDCPGSNSLCASVSLASTLSDIYEYGEDLKTLGQTTLRTIIRRAKKQGHIRRAKKLRRKLNSTYKQFQAEVDGLPASHYVCKS